jgi:hypothetical protein
MGGRARSHMSVMNDKTATTAPDAAGLARLAASWGPGHSGRRAGATLEQRAGLARTMAEAGLTVPSYLERPQRWVDRQAKLFEAGEYPDKGVRVRPEDLAALAENFDLPVPVLIEHATSPLELGYLTAVEARDGELYGTVALTQEADLLIESSGAGALSVGLAPDLTAIRELSLVQQPRVASARLFGGLVEFTSPLAAGWRSEKSEFERQRDEAWVAGLIEQGRLVPAQAGPALALLSFRGEVAFDGATTPVRRLVEQLLAAAPGHRMFGSRVADRLHHPAPLPPDEAEFYRRHFPGLSLEEIARRRAGTTAGNPGTHTPWH